MATHGGPSNPVADSRLRDAFNALAAEDAANAEAVQAAVLAKQSQKRKWQRRATCYTC